MRKKRRKLYTTNWLKPVRRKRRVKVPYKQASPEPKPEPKLPKKTK